MATKKPRSMITFEPEDHLILRRLADLQGVSLSSIVGELIHEVAPTLLTIINAIEEAKVAASSLTPEAKSRLLAKLENQENEAEKARVELQQEVSEGIKASFDLVHEQINAELTSGNDKA
jgi:hypothetical protein